jgi:RNA polymerase sigma-70 factor (ECF subfamily)
MSPTSRQRRQRRDDLYRLAEHACAAVRSASRAVVGLTLTRASTDDEVSLFAEVGGFDALREQARRARLLGEDVEAWRRRVAYEQNRAALERWPESPLRARLAEQAAEQSRQLGQEPAAWRRRLAAERVRFFGIVSQAAQRLGSAAGALAVQSRIRLFAGEDDQRLVLRAIFGDEPALVELARRKGHVESVMLGPSDEGEEPGEEDDEDEEWEPGGVEPEPGPAASPRSRAAEERLIARAQAGDGDAFGELVAPYTAWLRRYAYRQLRNDSDADDALQAALVEAWRSIGSLRERAAITGWLTTITRRKTLDMHRQRRRFKLVAAHDEEQLPDPRVLDPGELVALLTSVDAAFADLAEAYRAVAELRLAEGYSEQETARMLGVPVNTVKSRLNRARAQLVAALLAEPRAAALPEAG